MKIKRLPSDFRVEELTEVAPGSEGEQSLYRLEKSGWTTPDAIGSLRRRWKIDAPRLSYGGLKDRHAETTQHLTIFRGPERDLELERIRVKYLGKTLFPFTPRDILGNRFTLVVRHLTESEARRALQAAHNAAITGVPNYFDDQRFGSVGPDGVFIAKELILGHFEEALKRALAAPYAHDRAEEKRQKGILREYWGRWPECKAVLAKSHARSLVDYLVHHPADYKGAIARLRPELQGLYLSAYQSFLWNRMLDRRLRELFPASDLGTVTFRVGSFAVPSVDGPGSSLFRTLELPLPSARLKLRDTDAESFRIASEVVAEEGFPLEKMKISGLDKPFFSKGNRPACVQPRELTASEEVDDLHPKRRKLKLSFTLPRGAYATMILKWIVGWHPE